MNDDLHCMWMWCRFFVADGQGKDKVLSDLSVPKKYTN